MLTLLANHPDATDLVDSHAILAKIMQRDVQSLFTFTSNASPMVYPDPYFIHDSKSRYSLAAPSFLRDTLYFLAAPHSLSARSRT